ncbi:MAG: hypothetical protein PWP58_1310 [Bacillota bacterium]|nr:hypothetical protein [Bacillota bacterium]
MPIVRVYINGEWLPFESLQEQQQLALRTKIGDIIAKAIKQQIKELCSTGKVAGCEENTAPGCLHVKK